MAASLLLGFPWADDEHEMVNILVTTLDDPCTADAIATRIAKEFWRRRADFKFRCENYDTEESLKVAFKAAIEDKIKPVFISDSGDNPTAAPRATQPISLSKFLQTNNCSTDCQLHCCIRASTMRAHCRLSCCRRG